MVWRCFAYGRLSKEDAGHGERSGSIANQCALLHSFIEEKPDLQLVMEGYDDGLTGTNFDRPQFQRMLRAIEAGEVDCVVVKDLSRFGREYIGAGRFLERLFPQWGVRFISISEGYDSIHLSPSDHLMLPFRNLINDSYSHDTSVKIRTALDVKRKKGDFIGAFTWYGYRKDPENRNRLLVDQEAASVVRAVFAWRLAGMSDRGIAGKLTGLGIPSPAAYKRERGERFHSGFQTHDRAAWSAVAVRRVLSNEIYLGVTEQGKRTTPNYKVRTVRRLPKEDWVRVEGTHEPIIRREDFELVQRLLLLDVQVRRGEETAHVLAGLLYCRDCLSAMARKTVTEGERRWVYYICALHKKDRAQCASHIIRADRLETALMAGLRLYASLAAAAVPETLRRSDAVRLIDHVFVSEGKRLELALRCRAPWV